MKIHIWGCLSGTEPMPGKHHTSWALEKDGILWWFDAGGKLCPDGSFAAL